MSFVRVAALLAFGSFAGIVIACTGGGGPVDQGGDNGDQNDKITGESSGSSVSKTSSSSSSSSSGGSTYTPQADLLASGYNQNCAEDGECYPVQEGAICTACSCQNAAVATSDYLRFVTEFSKRRSMCDPTQLTGGACAPCSPPSSHCDATTKRCVYGK